MKVSKTWLQSYFEKPLPDISSIAEKLTFHSSEIESVEGEVLDVKILPNRAADLLSHRGIAKELSAILNVPLKTDPLREPVPTFHTGAPLSVNVENPQKCLRFLGAVIRGVTVQPSPQWLRETLESVGQRSINNVVDATNYVMLTIGQPLHAFDAGKLQIQNSEWKITVRGAKKEEKITVLSGETYTLPEGAVVITDGNTNEPIGIAGIKGGQPASITEKTKDIIVEAANFDGTLIRKTAQALKLFTDASQRFQNRPSPELPAYALRDVLKIILEIAGGELAGVVDVYPTKPEGHSVSVTREKISKHLGVTYTDEQIAEVFSRLDLPFKKEGEMFVVTPPFERKDLIIPEDLAEEVGRIMGYDNVPATILPPIPGTPDQARFRGIEKIKDQLIDAGFIEVSTQSFAGEGEIALANPLDNTKPALRVGFLENIKEAMERAVHWEPLVLGPKQKLKLFEIGTIFPKTGEELAIGTSESVGGLTIHDDAAYQPQVHALGAYKQFSIYPFVIRDVAFWVSSPEGETPLHVRVDADTFKSLISEHAGPLLARIDLFDQFQKDGRISYAFRLIFQSQDRTLSDIEVNEIINTVSGALSQIGHEVR